MATPSLDTTADVEALESLVVWKNGSLMQCTEIVSPPGFSRFAVDSRSAAAAPGPVTLRLEEAYRRTWMSDLHSTLLDVL